MSGAEMATPHLREVRREKQDDAEFQGRKRIKRCETAEMSFQNSFGRTQRLLYPLGVNRPGLERNSEAATAEGSEREVNRWINSACVWAVACAGQYG